MKYSLPHKGRRLVEARTQPINLKNPVLLHTR